MNLINRSRQSYSALRKLDFYMARHKGFIGGGCFKNIFLGKEIKDIDVFFNSKEDFAEALKAFKKDEAYVASYENQNAVAFKNKRSNVRVELVRHTYGTPEEMLALFDFSITKFAYYKEETSEGYEYKCVFVDTFFEDLTNRKLVIDGQLIFPVSTFERTYRYKGYGFGLCKESKGKLIEALQGVDTSDLGNDLYFGID